jgi:hypothetical protein
MSTPAKKRAAEQEQVSTSSKRPATGTAEYVTLEDEENCTYHLTVKLYSKYDVLPMQLRGTLQRHTKKPSASKWTSSRMAPIPKNVRRACTSCPSSAVSNRLRLRQRLRLRHPKTWMSNLALLSFTPRFLR